MTLLLLLLLLLLLPLLLASMCFGDPCYQIPGVINPLLFFCCRCWH
jgi:hypothetical protein